MAILLCNLQLIKNGKKMTQEINSIFINNLKKIIQYSQLSQQDFAERIGISFKLLNNILHNRSKPNYVTLVNIAKEFNVSLDWLMQDKGIMFGESRLDSELYRAISMRIVLLRMIEQNIQEALSIRQILLQNKLPNQDNLSEEAFELSQLIFKMTKDEETIIEIYNRVLQVPDKEERLMLINNFILNNLFKRLNLNDEWLKTAQEYEHNIALSERVNLAKGR